MMRPKTLSTALTWLAALALAVQGFGAPAWLEACQCLACECGPQVQEKSCCEGHAVPTDAATCCQTLARDCTQATPIPGSCCCIGTDPGAPANLPKGDKSSPDKPLLQVNFAPEASVAPPAAPSVIPLTDVRHESPPLRILYCVWRI